MILLLLLHEKKNLTTEPKDWVPPIFHRLNKLPLSAIYMTSHSRRSDHLRQMKPLSKNIPKEKTAHTCPAPTANTPIRHVQVTIETMKSERKHLKEICATFYLLTETAQTQLPLHSAKA